MIVTEILTKCLEKSAKKLIRNVVLLIEWRIIIMELLNRARKINAMLQKSAGNAVNFNDMSATLSEVIKGNVFILSRRGKLLGFAINDEIENERMKSMLEEKIGRA